MKSVHVGRNCNFYGLPYVFRYYNSTIRIGDACVFRSDRTSNLIGVNGKCILATQGEGAMIQIGNSCGFSGVRIGAAQSITLGDNVFCGANVVITDFDWHALDPRARAAGEVPQPLPVHVADNVWLGLDVVVLKGVSIGRNTVIGARSLVVTDIPANVIAGGNPCKVIRPLST